MPSRVRTPLLGCFACIFGLFVVTLVAFKVGAGERFDAHLLEHLSAESGTIAHGIATGFAHLADPPPFLLILIGICVLGRRWGRRREVVAAVLLVAGANLTTEILKVMFSHERFWLFLGPEQPWTNSFPSGHTTAAASLALAALLVVPARLRSVTALLGLFLTAAVGLSVVMLEWHYPSDVAGGLLIAAGWGCAALAGLRLLEPAERERKKPQTSRPFAISVK